MTAQTAEPQLVCPPAYVWRPPRVRSMALQLSLLAERLGRPLDPEQYEALDVLTGEQTDGRPASLGACAIGPRQNFKSWSFELIALGRLLRPDGDSLIVWSAHEVSTAQNSFRDLQELIETHAWLSKRVAKVSQANGKEGICFTGNSASAGRRWLRFKARIQTGGRGLTGDCVILDEAFALQAAHMGALLPILSTRRRAAVFYGSSAGLVTSEILRGIRDRGRRGGRGAPAYVEWCAPGSFADPGCDKGVECTHIVGTAGCVLDREDYWLAANFAAAPGRRITIEYLREERGELPPVEFARERLGWWQDPAGEVVDFAAWAELADPDSKPQPRPVCIGVDVAPGLTGAAVAAAGYRDDGLAHVEILAHEQGTAWLVEFLADLWKRGVGPVWHVGGTAPVNAVAPDWGRPDVEAMTATDYAAGCGGIEAMVRDRRLRHLDDPILTGALGGAARKDVGDGAWVLQRSASRVDICPAVAAVVALRALIKQPTPATAPMVTWR